MTTLIDRPVEAEADEPTPSRSEGQGRMRRFVRGRPNDPAWVRPSLLALLVGTAVAYVWALGDSGWANSFYAAAVQAGTKSWKAFFFGSSDASNFITVNKPPASLWVMELSARIFGLNSWSLLVPQALEGVAAVGVLYATVRRWFSPGAALIAGAVLATTPVAALMFRYNNPDALLVLLLTGAAYALVRALERGSTRWLLLAGALVGTGFITKMMQAFLVVPAFALVFLLCAPVPLWDRIKKLLLAALALIVASGWWVAGVELTPAADRPYIGGSQNNNILNLIFGYNGFGRLSGNEAGSVVGGAVGGTGGGSMWGPTGIDRLFLSSMGGQISWLIPSALLFFVVGLWMTRRCGRTDRTRAALILWGGWLLVTGLVFSFAQGIIHPYYTVALAPAVGALIGIGTSYLWQRRKGHFPRITLAVGLAGASVWSFVLLDRSPTWLPVLRWVVLVVGLACAVGLAISARLRGRVALAAGAVGIGAAMAGPIAYSLDTVNTPHSGAIPSAGPTLVGSFGGFGARGAAGGFGGGAGGFRGAASPGAGTSNGRLPAGALGPGAATSGRLPTSFNPGAFAKAHGFTGKLPTNGRSGLPGGGLGGGFAGGGAGGGFLNATTPGAKVTQLLEKDASKYKWVAATVNSNSAAGYQLATDDPVMAIGGFNGTDPAPTLAEFKQYVKEGEIHYFIAGSGGLGSGGSGTTASQITSWVEAHYKAQTVDGVTLYNLR